MNLIVDIGNSTAKAAVFKDGEMVLRKRLNANLEDGIAMIVEEFDIDACAYSSVGKARLEVDEAIKHMVPEVFHVTGETATPLICDYLTPETLGADRLAAAVGAAYCCPGHDLLIVDAGTCITYDYVSASGHYLGGNISLGMGMRLRALHEQTARLPLVSAEGEAPFIGRNTQQAIRTGVIRGMDYEIKSYIRDMRQQYADARVFLTGGNGYRFAQEYEVERNDALVEIGLNCILEYQRR
jgi:type III pantothenate kinase